MLPTPAVITGGIAENVTLRWFDRIHSASTWVLRAERGDVMRYRVSRARTGALLAAAALAAAVAGLAIGPADATVTCPVVDPSTHAVSPVPYYGIDWSGCDLSGADLTDAALSHANLTGANLSAASLDGADLDTADLTSADLSNASLTSADLDWATLTEASLGSANLHGAYLLYAVLTKSDLDQADLGGTTLTAVTSGGVTGTPAALPAGVALMDGYLIGPDLIMNGANLAGQNLAGIDLSGSSLQQADLAQATLSNADLNNTDLTGTSLDSANLTGANLLGATLTGATLAGATLTRVSSGSITGTPQSLPANWTLLTPNGYLAGPRADLAGAKLSYSGISNGDLAGADLSGATLIGAKFTDTDFAGADLSQIDAQNASFDGSDLSGAELTSASLYYANLGGADLAGADLTSATLTGLSSGGVTGSPHALPGNWALAGGFLIGPYAYLDGGNLSHLDLSGLDFDDAYLVSTDFSYANLTGATLAGTQGPSIWLDTTCPDGSNSNKHVAGCLSGLDTTPPKAQPVITKGTRGTAGWYTSPVTVDWNWVDDGTIVAADCPATSTTTTQGAVSLSATCTDLAGNQGTGLFSVNVDTAPPAVSVTGVKAGASYVYGKVPAAGCRTVDNVSGVVTAAHRTVTPSGTNGTGQFTVSCAGAADRAGNTQATPVQASYLVRYGFGGFTSPQAGSTISRSGDAVKVSFWLANAAGTPISAARASALAAAGAVRATLSGPGIAAVSALCHWNASRKLLGCTITIPAGVRTGSAVYSITAAENLGTGFRTAPAAGQAVNPEKIHFK
jgi:uncharacterized protein YjbI with pentapeptide repeats